MSVQINKLQVIKKVLRYGDPEIKKALRAKVLPAYYEARDKMFQEFDNHKVSREINNGPYAKNISNTLGGSKDKKAGNLFSYLGFRAGRSPVMELRALMWEQMRGPTYRKSGGASNPVYIVTIKRPSMESMQDEEALRVDGGYSGRDWVSMIENGIDNASFFLFDSKKRFKTSKSGPAIQVRHELSDKTFTGHDYVSKMIEKFDKRMTRNIKRAGTRSRK